MKFSYSLQAEDFLVHQLYSASISSRIKRNRAMSKWAVPVFYIFFAGYLYLSGSDLIGVALLIGLTVLWILFYPMYQKRRYKNHYLNFIKENYSERFNRAGGIEFHTDYLFSSDDGSEGKIKVTEIKELIELPTHFLIRIKGGQAFIIPKLAVVDKVEFLAYFSAHQVPIIDASTWEWK